MQELPGRLALSSPGSQGGTGLTQGDAAAPAVVCGLCPYVCLDAKLL